MSLLDEFSIVIRGLTQRKIRSWLTVLGVVIGIAAIVALISVSTSLESSIKEQFEQFGTDKNKHISNLIRPRTQQDLTQF